MKKTKRLTYVTMLSAMAIVIHIFEGTFIPPIAMGVKFGLANIIALIALELFGVKEMVIVNTMRVVIGSLLRGTLFGSVFWISAGGVVLSSLILIVTYYLKSSIVFKSILSAFAHSCGQIMVVMLLYQQSSMMIYLPVMLATAVPTGILTGVISTLVLKRIKI
ncbi:MAG: Gx transporter family protein [Erysipelotrichaceae bacterium]